MNQFPDKTYLFLAEGFEEIEALTVVDMLRRADIPIEMISITKEQQVTGSHGICVKADRLLSDTDFSQAHTLVLPGGVPGTPNLAGCRPLCEKLSEFAMNGKRVAAICAAPSVLGSLGLLKGRKAVCYPGWEDKLTGALIQSGAKTVVDANIITGRGMGTAIDFSLALISEVKGSETAASIKSGIQYF